MPLTLGPIERFALCFKCAEYVIRMIFNNIIVDTAALPGGPSAVLQPKRLPSFVSYFADLIFLTARATSFSPSFQERFRRFSRKRHHEAVVRARQIQAEVMRFLRPACINQGRT